MILKDFATLGLGNEPQDFHVGSDKSALVAKCLPKFYAFAEHKLKEVM